MTEQREIDSYNEQSTHSFLEEHFYNTALFDSYQTITNSKEQKAGTDVVINSKMLQLNNKRIDEKGAFHFCNTNLRTFAQEIGYYKDSSHMDGWLVKENSNTDYYLFMWLKVNYKPAEIVKDRWLRLFDKNEIYRIVFCMVERSKIQNSFKEKGYDIDMLKRIEMEYRNSHIVHDSDEDKRRKQEMKDNELGFTFYLSKPENNKEDSMIETPFTAPLSSKVLKTLSIGYGVITKQKTIYYPNQNQDYVLAYYNKLVEKYKNGIL